MDTLVHRSSTGRLCSWFSRWVCALGVAAAAPVLAETSEGPIYPYLRMATGEGEFGAADQSGAGGGIAAGLGTDTLPVEFGSARAAEPRHPGSPGPGLGAWARRGWIAEPVSVEAVRKAGRFGGDGSSLATSLGLHGSPSSGGDAVVFRTGSGSVLQSEAVFLDPRPTEARDFALELEFGVSTDETWEPGQFLDSFTIRLVNAAGDSLYLVTSDASGVSWFPGLPGGVPGDPSSLQYGLVDFAIPGEARAQTVAYDVRFLLPAPWQGEPLRVAFEFFDNQDAARSLGYFRQVTLVPEPSSIVLFLAGAGWLFLRRRRG